MDRVVYCVCSTSLSFEFQIGCYQFQCVAHSDWADLKLSHFALLISDRRSEPIIIGNKYSIEKYEATIIVVPFAKYSCNYVTTCCLHLYRAISAAVCLFVCLSICPLAYLKNHMSKLHHIFCTCGRVLSFSDGSATCYVLCTSGFVDDVMFRCNGGNGPESKTANRPIFQLVCPVITLVRCQITLLG